MGDLEQALLAAYRDAWTEMLPNGPSHQVMFGIKIAPIVDEALAAARIEEREKVAAFMLTRSIPTGHGDTIEDLLIELGGYLDRLAERQ